MVQPGLQTVPDKQGNYPPLNIKEMPERMSIISILQAFLCNLIFLFICSIFVLINYFRFCHPANLSIFQPHLYTAGMKCRGSKNIFYDTIGEFSRTLIFFQNDRHFLYGINIFTILSVHLKLQQLTFRIIRREQSVDGINLINRNFQLSVKLHEMTSVFAVDGINKTAGTGYAIILIKQGS